MQTQVRPLRLPITRTMKWISLPVKVGWAEQQPEIWWDNLRAATQRLLQAHPVERSMIKGIGISYQMHGLVLVDKDQRVLRPAIIWCDSRAIQIGNQAFQEIGGTTMPEPSFKLSRQFYSFKT